MNPTWQQLLPALREKAVIFDIGGYKGAFAQLCIEQYKNPMVYVFEPVREHYTELLNRFRFQTNCGVFVFNYGLGANTQYKDIFKNGDESSFIWEKGLKENCEMCDIVSLLQWGNQYDYSKIDLMKINIEGGEYELLEHLFKSEKALTVKHYLIQYHKDVPEADSRREAIRSKMRENYELMINYDWTFELWTKK